MDKKSLLGFVLIGIVLMIWLYWNSSTQQKMVQQNKNKITDSIKVQEKTLSKNPEINAIDTSKKSLNNVILDSLKNDSLNIKYGKLFSQKAIENSANPKEKIIILENEKVQMEFSNYGGGLKKYTIKNYETWDNKPLQLVDWKKGKELHLLFTSREGRLINTKDLVFESEYPEWKKVELGSDTTFKLIYTLNITPDGSEKISKTYTFFRNQYEFDVEYEFKNPVKFISDNKYQVV